MPVKAFDSTGTGSLADIITGIDYALTNGAQVLNNSWGGPGFSQALADAIERANQKGVLFVAAAGGDSGPGTDLDTSGSPFYPCAYTNANVICVAAVTPAGDLSSYSNYGAATVAVGAPGDNITSTIRNQGYGSLSGTSMATPHVTGAVGLIKGCKAGLTASAIKNAILTTTSYLDALNGKVVANGMVNYAAAINSPAVAGTGNCDPSPNNVLPTANAGGPYNSNAKKPIQFNGTGSTDPDGQILLYVWDFGDGGAALGPKPVHQYTASGTYGATLTVRDNLGGISTNTATVTVRPNGKVLGPVSKP
jgi:subtilisin family serine protease